MFASISKLFTFLPSTMRSMRLIAFVLVQLTICLGKNTYIIYLRDELAQSLDVNGEETSKAHLLASIMASKDKAEESTLYSYKNINAFAAFLEGHEAAKIEEHPYVISVVKGSLSTKMQTTRSWEFLGVHDIEDAINSNSPDQDPIKGNIIIGIIDNGVWASSPSFKDDGMGPVPSRWKGSCDAGDAGAICNRKLIGMRSFFKGYEEEVGPLDSSMKTASDTFGHGTYVASIAAGRRVANASFFGYAQGTARGGAPWARLASYKACWGADGYCSDADVLAAFDAAISDGVDIISVSLYNQKDNYTDDAVAVGAFHAVRNGMAVVCCAGNDGSSPGTVANAAPWIITVAASSIDRRFPSCIILGNGKLIIGESLSTTGLPPGAYPLITGAEARATNATLDEAMYCTSGSLDPQKVNGRIVVCTRGLIAMTEKSMVVKLARGAGLILLNDETFGDDLIGVPHIIPTSQASYTDGKDILDYIKTTECPVGYIELPITKLNARPAPRIAAFSSRGPNIITPEILKPDIAAPGVSILAAFSPKNSPTFSEDDERRVLFNILFGTSVACPHVTGAVAILKALHPNWSTAIIRSAIMTTARTHDMDGNVIIDDVDSTSATPYAFGSGNIDITNAKNPGLAYDLSSSDYEWFLCVTNTTIGGTKCHDEGQSILDFNYPSIVVTNFYKSTIVRRRLMNVSNQSTYVAKVTSPPGVSVSISPRKLSFNEGEEKQYTICLTPISTPSSQNTSFGSIAWVNGYHVVKSILVVCYSE